MRLAAQREPGLRPGTGDQSKCGPAACSWEQGLGGGEGEEGATGGGAGRVVVQMSGEQGEAI